MSLVQRSELELGIISFLRAEYWKYLESAPGKIWEKLESHFCTPVSVCESSQKMPGDIQLLRCTETATESWLFSWPHESSQNVGTTTTRSSRGGQEYVCKLSFVKQLCQPEVNVYLALQRKLYEMCRYLMASPRVCHCGLGQKEISYGLARDRQELSETEHAFISVPAWRVAKEGIRLRDFQAKSQGSAAPLSLPFPTENLPCTQLFESRGSKTKACSLWFKQTRGILKRK